MSDRYARAAAATGIFSVVLIVIAFLVQPKPPDADASSAEFLTYVVDHHKALHVGQLLFGAGTFLFLWFIGALRSILGAAEGAQGRLATTAYGGGLITAAALIVFYAAAALHPAANGPDITHALVDASTMVLAVSAPAAVVFFVANGLSILRTGFLPAWLAWLAWLALVTALFNAFGLGNVFTDHGAFASDGVLGFLIGFLLFLVWVLAASIVLVRKLAGEQAATAT